MHTFQPYPIELLEMNPFTKIAKEWALLTAGTKDNANPMTVSWGGVGVLWGKNVAYLFVRDSRYTKELIDHGEFFSLSFLDEKYRSSLQFCGSHSGRDGNKWDETNLNPAFRHGIPYPDEANLVMLCQKMAAVPLTEDTFLDPSIKGKWYADGDMHTMYIAEIIDVMAR